MHEPVPDRIGRECVDCMLQDIEGIDDTGGEDCRRFDELREWGRKRDMIAEVTKVLRVWSMVEQATGLAYHKYCHFL